ncbi:MAG TPA: AtpZ/AtpI family protein, partial [Thermoanaerobaculia bacterium]|nr:AtpZ/AtpI family protein [Thermoanaerobaculia bacterium]
SEEPKRNPWLRLSSLGMELAGAAAGGTLLGYWLDRRYGTSPRWLLVGALVGIGGGLYNLIRSALAASRESSREAERQKRQDGNDRDG